MKRTTIDRQLESLGACIDARDWAEGKGFTRIYQTCKKGSWLAWLVVATESLTYEAGSTLCAKIASVIPREKIHDEALRNYIDLRLSISVSLEEILIERKRVFKLLNFEEAAGRGLLRRAIISNSPYWCALLSAEWMAYTNTRPLDVEKRIEKQIANIIRENISMDRFKVKYD